MKKISLLFLFCLLGIGASAQDYVRVYNASTVDLTVGSQYTTGTCTISSEDDQLITSGSTYTFYVPAGENPMRVLFDDGGVQRETYPSCGPCSGTDDSGSFTFTWTIISSCNQLYLVIDN